MEHKLDLEHAPAGNIAYGGGEDLGRADGVDRKDNAETINALIHAVCEDLCITEEQLYAELEEGGDLPDIRSGTITFNALRLTTETLALMRYTSNAEQETETEGSYNMGEAA